jgi:ketosteroid isomerase-like protein
VSRAGDLAFTYGDALWQKDGQAVRGHYVRVWQRRRGAWKLIVDELTPVPKPHREAG